MSQAECRIYSGDLEDLAETVTGFCRDEYGESCEFYQVSIERVRDGGSWKIHEFQNFEERTARAVKNHLSAGDVVRVEFGGEGAEVELVICPSGEPAPVARFVDLDEIGDLGNEDYLVVSTGGRADEKLLESIK